MVKSFKTTPHDPFVENERECRGGVSPERAKEENHHPDKKTPKSFAYLKNIVTFVAFCVTKDSKSD
jgi:hypothetical protein